MRSISSSSVWVPSLRRLVTTFSRASRWAAAPAHAKGLHRGCTQLSVASRRSAAGSAAWLNGSVVVMVATKRSGSGSTCRHVSHISTARPKIHELVTARWLHDFVLTESVEEVFSGIGGLQEREHLAQPSLTFGVQGGSRESEMSGWSRLTSYLKLPRSSISCHVLVRGSA